MTFYITNVLVKFGHTVYNMQSYEHISSHCGFLWFAHHISKIRSCDKNKNKKIACIAHILWELPLWKKIHVRDDVKNGRLNQFLNIVIF